MSCRGSQGPCIALTLRGSADDRHAQQMSTLCPLLQQLRQTRQPSLQSSSVSYTSCLSGWNALRRACREKPCGLGGGVGEGLCCHRCQQPGHIAGHCRAPAPIPAGRRQPVVANSAPECDARNSAVPAAAVEPDKRSNGVDRKSVLSLTDTASDAGAVSQASSSKPRGQRRRSRRKNASPRFPDVVPIQRTQRQGVWLFRIVDRLTSFHKWNLRSRISGSPLWAGHRRPR